MLTNFQNKHFAVDARFDRGSLREGTKFPSTTLQPFASMGCSQYIDFFIGYRFIYNLMKINTFLVILKFINLQQETIPQEMCNQEPLRGIYLPLIESPHRRVHILN